MAHYTYLYQYEALYPLYSLWYLLVVTCYPQIYFGGLRINIKSEKSHLWSGEKLT